MSDDYGKSWKNISNNLPNSSINVIKEDPVNENILYVGSDIGTYISIDQGKSWEAFKSGLTTAAVHDIVIQEKENDLLIGTHGRSIYKTSLKNIQSLNSDIINKSIYFFDINEIKYSKTWGNKGKVWADFNIPSVNWESWISEEGDYEIIISSNSEGKIFEKTYFLDKGFNTINYNLRYSLVPKKNKNKVHLGDDNFYYLTPGNYSLKIKRDKKEYEHKFTVKSD